jgi:hypothetical protein
MIDIILASLASLNFAREKFSVNVAAILCESRAFCAVSNFIESAIILL